MKASIQHRLLLVALIATALAGLAAIRAAAHVPHDSAPAPAQYSVPF